jgi:hypothetical protein
MVKVGIDRKLIYVHPMEFIPYVVPFLSINQDCDEAVVASRNGAMHVQCEA